MKVNIKNNNGDPLKVMVSHFNPSKGFEFPPTQYDKIMGTYDASYESQVPSGEIEAIDVHVSNGRVMLVFVEKRSARVQNDK